MNVAYFTNQYPKVSHSFIRREINALERRGLIVERFAVRSNPEELVDPQDKEEFEKTRYLLSASVMAIIAAIVETLLLHPLRFCCTLWSALLMGRRSDRGILRHLFYFVEACLLKKWLDEAKVEHVHAHFGTNPTMVVMLCNGLGGPPYSFTVHGPEEFDKPEFLSLGEKIRRSAFVVAISSYGRSQLYRWCEYTDWQKIQIVRCGLDAQMLEPSAQFFSRRSQADKFRFVTIGRLCEQKGQMLLLEALCELKARNVDCEVRIIGDGPFREQLEYFVSENSLNDYVNFLGALSGKQIRDELDDCDAFALPSFAEGLPVVIMEAFARSKPVLSTYIAGIPELVVPECSGWLVPAGNSFILAECMQEITQMQSEKLTEMGLVGRKAVLERHDVLKEAITLSSLFRQSAGR